MIPFWKDEDNMQEEIEKVHSEIKLSFDRNRLCVVKTKLAWFVAKMILQNGPTGFRNSWNWRRGGTEKTGEPMLKFASCMRKLIKKNLIWKMTLKALWPMNISLIKYFQRNDVLLSVIYDLLIFASTETWNFLCYSRSVHKGQIL